MRKKYRLAVLGAILLLGIALRFYGLEGQPALRDETQSALTAVHYMESGQFWPTMWFHPNLRNILIYLSTSLFGYGPYGLRLVSLLAGVLTIPLMYAFTKSLTENDTAALVSAFLISIEQVHITFSRQAIQETTTTFLFLAGTVLAIFYYKREMRWMLVLSGLAFGLGVASKFHAIPPMLACAGAGFLLSWREKSAEKAFFVFACLLVLPLTVYLLTYIPWFGRGYGLSEWMDMQKVVLNAMLTHAGNPGDLLIDIRPWQWFLRPMGYANFVLSEGKPFVTVSFSNPLVWLLVLPGALYIAVKLIKGRLSGSLTEGLRFLLLLFGISYLPLALSPRPVWLLSSLAVLPFALPIVAYLLVESTKRAGYGKTLLSLYLILITAGSLFLYPMAIGRAESHGYLNSIVEKYRPPFEQTGGDNGE